LVFHPYRRPDDYNLAFLTNFLLICCFTLGMILKLCDKGQQEEGTCQKFIGGSIDPSNASLIVVIIVVGVLFLTIGFLVTLTYTKMTAPTVRMLPSGYAPHLDLPEDCNFHIFMSHVWSTGQDQTHSIVRKMQLLLPGLKVWLDVDELHDISRLEESIAESAVFVLFYSRHYFRSRNCRREIYAAIQLGKPIILLYEGDSLVLEEMKKECMSNCINDGDSGGDDVAETHFILKKLLGSSQTTSNSFDGPIQWLKEGAFSAAALNRIFYRVLYCLPYYQKHRNELEKGMKVPGMLGNVSLRSQIDLLVFDGNIGSFDVAEELKEALPQVGPEFIFVTKATTYFESKKVEGDENRKITTKRNHRVSNRPAFLLLYLNQYTFLDNGQEQRDLTAVLQSCLDANINVILVHEQDIKKGGCPFDTFFNEAPSKLINEPYCLFKQIAVPLYSRKEYRDVSLKLILHKIRDSLNKGEGVVNANVEQQI
jgi:hypothetical protein